MPGASGIDRAERRSRAARAARAWPGRRARTAGRRTAAGSRCRPASTTPACSSTGRSDGVRARASAAPARDASTTSTSDRPGLGGRPGALGGPSGHGQDGALHRSHDGLAGQLVGDGQGLGRARSGPGRPAEQLRPSDRPRSSWERMTPELPRAPISEPWAMARQVASRSGDVEAGELVGHRLEGEGHVGAGVAVGHRVDVEPVDQLLVGAEPVPVRGDHLARAPLLRARRGPPWPGC